MTSAITKNVNAVILAAGKSSRFFPPLYDRPKGLFSFRGEVLIERQIEQLKAAGIDDIAIVIGYEKERFFYLEEKYDVDLIVSTKYNDESNLSSLYAAKHKLNDTYICCADHWYEANPFSPQGFNQSVRVIKFQQNASREFVVTEDEQGRLCDLKCGSYSGLCMAGFAYFTADFSQLFISLYEVEKDYIGVKQMLWEEFWGNHISELPLYGICDSWGVLEFDSLSDLQKMDGNVLENVSQRAISNIQALCKCDICDIKCIEPLNKGLTNVSFSFFVNNKRYVYRQPGASSANLVDRDTEVLAQTIASNSGIDSSVIAINREGWKLSKYIDIDRQFDYNDKNLLEKAIDQIKLFHSNASGIHEAKHINMLLEGRRLLDLATSKKEYVIDGVEFIYEDLIKLWHYIELDNWPKVLCHNDTYAVNWLVGVNSLDLIDWEYAGINDPVNDIATLVVRDSLNENQIEEILFLYFEGKVTYEQRRHAYGCFALCGWYWYCWSLYKDTLNEDGFFMLPSWKALHKYLPLALSMYREN